MAIKIILIIIAALIAGNILFAVFTPYPAVYFVRWLFRKYPYTPPSDYPRYLENVTIQSDIDFGSAYKNGRLDIIKPKNFTGGEKVIFAIHGGAYISEGCNTGFYY
ncbi:MAG: hypothetical protein LBP37_03535, partial [Spirochaetaceae bacterium]|nr:hypothetical protein [Spirochaetaceae bacterium]